MQTIPPGRVWKDENRRIAVKIMESVLEYAAREVRNLAPYEPGRPAAAVAAERGLDDAIKLASNENPLGAGAAALRVLRALPAAAVSRYPDGNCGALRAAVAERIGVAPARLIFGNGSNEILELAAQLVLTPGAAALYSRHAFAVYALAVAARRGRGIAVAAADYAHDLEALAARAKAEDARLIFIANPNNPTGSWHPPEKITRFLEKIAPGTLVVLDEAYREYVDGEDGISAPQFVNFPNLLITRTFSKIHGLAGLRIGFGIGAPELIEILNRIRQPFNVGGAAQAAALAALSDRAHVARSVEINAAGMAQIGAGLDKLGVRRLPSRANFITFDAGGAKAAARTYDGLLDAGIIVRPLGGYEMPGWLRVSIGTDAENCRFLRELKRLWV